MQGVIKPAPTAKNETAKYIYVPELFSGNVINRAHAKKIKPVPEIVNLNSPNSFTSGPINPPCTTIATIPTTISGPSESFIDQRREFCKKNTRIVVNPVKAIKYMKKASESLLILFSLKGAKIPLNGLDFG